jgi:hypothetical protein
MSGLPQEAFASASQAAWDHPQTLGREPSRVELRCTRVTPRFYDASLPVPRALQIDRCRSVGVTQRTMRLSCSPAAHHTGIYALMPDDSSRWTMLPRAARGTHA